jgi:prepilin-type processing-associated H-X9-DG protein
VSGIESLPRDKKPQRYNFALWSFGFAIVSVLMFFCVYMLPNCLFVVFFLLSVALSVFLGFCAIGAIIRKKLQPKNLVIALIGIVLSLSFLIIPLLLQLLREREDYLQKSCTHDLKIIYMALEYYQEGSYPKPEVWCDSLLRMNESKGYFKFNFLECFSCPPSFSNTSEKRCNYAMNPNCEPNSPNDVVLLFETKGGWNQFGGPEILTFENHRGKGCNILFNDGHVEFINPEQVEELKWK